MTTTTHFVEAKVDTAIKLIDSPLPVASTDKFVLKGGERLRIKTYRDAANNHWEIELETPKEGHIIWFAYKPEVKICLEIT